MAAEAFAGVRGAPRCRQPRAAVTVVAALLLLLLRVSDAFAADADVIYQRTRSDGAMTLSNVPDGEGYEILLGQAQEAGAAQGAGDPGGVGSPADRDPGPPQASARTAAESLSGAARRHAPDTPPSIEARSGALLAGEAAAGMALDQASQANEAIRSAGGAEARLQDLYHASLSAFQARRAGAPGLH